MASSANSANATPTGRSARSALIAARGERVAGQQTGLHPPRIGDVRRIARHERARSRSARRRRGHRLATLQERRGHQRLQPARQVRFVQRDRMGNPRPEMSRRLAAACTRLAAGGVPATQRQRAARGRPCNTCAPIDHGQPPKISAPPSFGASEPCAGANWRTQAMRGCGGCGANHTMLNGAETLFVYRFPDRPAAPCPNQRPAMRHRARRFP